MFPFLLFVCSDFIKSPRSLKGRYFFLVYVSLSLLSCYAMIGTPQLPWRAEMPFVFFMVIAICGIINKIDWNANSLLKKTAICVSIYFFGMYLPESIGRTIIDSHRVQSKWAMRVEAFKSSKKAGISDMKSPEISSRNPHTGANRLYDGDCYTAYYYGLKSFESVRSGKVTDSK
ncbi:MAG TPA: DUF6056 family protein [Spirochaetota bacterium]|nr:DUF6056 family protein [Spirochaetota bacterium]